MYFEAKHIRYVIFMFLILLWKNLKIDVLNVFWLKIHDFDMELMEFQFFCKFNFFIRFRTRIIKYANFN